MTVTQKFVIGTNPGEYTSGSFVQDSLFEKGTINSILLNDTPTSSGYDHQPSVRRLYVGTIGVNWNNGDILIVNKEI